MAAETDKQGSAKQVLILAAEYPLAHVVGDETDKTNLLYFGGGNRQTRFCEAGSYSEQSEEQGSAKQVLILAANPPKQTTPKGYLAPTGAG